MLWLKPVYAPLRVDGAFHVPDLTQDDETGYAVCMRCSELNTPAEDGSIAKSLTPCEDNMQCGKVGGDYFYQKEIGAPTCKKCANSGRRGAFGCNGRGGERATRSAQLAFACAIRVRAKKEHAHMQQNPSDRLHLQTHRNHDAR